MSSEDPDLAKLQQHFRGEGWNLTGANLLAASCWMAHTLLLYLRPKLETTDWLLGLLPMLLCALTSANLLIGVGIGIISAGSYLLWKSSLWRPAKEIIQRDLDRKTQTLLVGKLVALCQSKQIDPDDLDNLVRVLTSSSLSTDFQFFQEQSLVQGIPLPVAVEELRHWLLDAKAKALKEKGNSTAPHSNWSTFDFCNQFLQTEQGLESAIQDILAKLSQENVVYAEIRFSPVLHTLQGLTPDQVIQSLIKGFRSQRQVQGGLIICCMRSWPEEHGIEMAELAAKYLGKGVVGMDICGDEGSYPMNSDSCPMAKGMRLAKAKGVPLTGHAGEWPDHKFKTLSNVTYLVRDLKADRIGHGLALKGHQELMEELKRRQVTVEVCLSSNLAFGYKVASFQEHPVRDFFKTRLPFALSSDNLFLSGDTSLRPSPNIEVLHLVEDVFHDNHRDGWRAVRFALDSAVKSVFKKGIDLSDVIKKADEVLAAHGINI